MRAIISKCLKTLSRIIFKLLPSSKISAIIYYNFVDRSFFREMYTVYAGRKNYGVIKSSSDDGAPLLRRNIHRIEKGLSMPERKSVFALDYIEETVSSYINYFETKTAKIPNDSERWFIDVLEEYFNSVSHENITIKRQFSRFSAIQHDRVVGNSNKSIPYTSTRRDKLEVSIESMRSLSVFRRSVRWYQTKAVDRVLLEQAMEIARMSPSACNRQPFHFEVIDSEPLLSKVVSIPMGVRGYEENIPCLIVIIGHWENYFDERDRHVPYIDSSLAAMSFMFALETLGLSSCSINWPDIPYMEKKMASLLNLPSCQKPIMLMSVGYALDEGKIPFSEKKSTGQLLRYK